MEVYRYYTVSRPPILGGLPKAELIHNQRSWLTQDPQPVDIPGDFTAWGWVEWTEPLPFKLMNGLLPADPVERAAYRFWQEADGDLDETKWLLSDYLGNPDDFLQDNMQQDSLCEEALIIKRVLQTDSIRSLAQPRSQGVDYLSLLAEVVPIVFD